MFFAFMSIDEIGSVRGVGPIIAEGVVKYFEDPGAKRLIEKLRKAGVNFTEPRQVVAGGALEGKTVVITGTLPTLTRPKATEAVEKAADHGTNFSVVFDQQHRRRYRAEADAGRCNHAVLDRQADADADHGDVHFGARDHAQIGVAGAFWTGRQRKTDQDFAGRKIAAEDALADVMGDCLAKGIKIVSNAGGLNPAGCAAAVEAIQRSIDAFVAREAE